MIDTLGIRYRLEWLTLDAQKRFISKIQKRKTTIDENGEWIFIKGEIENFIVTMNKTIIKIEGSLSRFFFGSNVHTLNPSQLKEALHKFTQLIGFQILKGYISRLDIADCFVVKESPLIYFNCMLETPAFARSRDKHGVRFEINKRQFVFYDKTIEAVKAHSFYLGPNKHVIRLELRYKAEVRMQLRRSIKKLLGLHLLSSNFLSNCANSFFDHYDEILKRRETRDRPQMKSWNDVKAYLASITISKIGVKQFLGDLEEIAIENNWSHRKLSDIQRNCQKLFLSDESSRPIKHVARLDKKVKHDSTISKFLKGD